MGRVVIRYALSEEKRALQVVAILKSGEPRIRQFYGMTEQVPLQIYLPHSRSEFDRLTGGGLPDWAAAVFLASRNAIVLKRPEWVASGYRLREELLHELSHAYFHRMFPEQKPPLWFNEGLAQFLSGKRITLQDGVVLANAILARKIIPLTDVDSLLQFSAVRARLAYLESLSAVEFIGNHYLVNKGWPLFLHEIQQHGFPAALQRVLGMDTIDFEWRWYRWLQKKYRWFVLFNLENLIWVAMVVVLAGAMYAVRYRNRKILQQWEWQEQQEDWSYFEQNPENSGDE
jgi:hypothetical protein